VFKGTALNRVARNFHSLIFTHTQLSLWLRILNLINI
jgi:hypothetical protein